MKKYPTLFPSALIIIIISILSLACAYILFNLLESSASIINEKIRLGGAIAGFIIIFYMLFKAFYKLFYSGVDLYNKSNAHKIEILENKIESLVFKELTEIEVNEEEDRYVNTDHKYTFIYPKTLPEFAPLDMNMHANCIINASEYVKHEVPKEEFYVLMIGKIDFLPKYTKDRTEQEQLNIATMVDPQKAFDDELENRIIVNERFFYVKNHLAKELVVRGIANDGYERIYCTRGILVKNGVLFLQLQAIPEGFDNAMNLYEKIYDSFNFVN